MTAPSERILYGDKQADGRTPFWRTPTLWAAATGRPQIALAVTDLQILNEVVWFGGPQNVEPTVKKIAERARDIFDADLSFPIIMTQSGEIIDGAHRIARAYLEGIANIAAVVIEDMPAPDGFIDDAA